MKPRGWLSVALLVGSVVSADVACAQRALPPERQVAALLEHGRLAEAESMARAGGPALTVVLGDVLVQRGRLDEAESLYVAAARGRLPWYRSAQASLAELAARHGRRDEAIVRADSLTKAFEQGRAWSAADQVAAARGYVVLGLSDPQAAHTALSVFDAAAALDSTNLDARLLAADLLLDKFNGPDAVETYQDVLAIAPGNARALLGLALVQAFEGNPAVTASAQKALAQNPSLVGAHLLLARLHLEAEALRLGGGRGAARPRGRLDGDAGMGAAWRHRLARGAIPAGSIAPEMRRPASIRDRPTSTVPSLKQRHASDVMRMRWLWQARRCRLTQPPQGHSPSSGRTSCAPERLTRDVGISTARSPSIRSISGTRTPSTCSTS